jgi:non-specific serine/threonine protein kinase
VAGLVAQGLTRQRIAATLVLTPRTVDTHLGRILRKLGLTSRAELAHWAVEARLLEPRST